MIIDFDNLDRDLEEGTFRQRIQESLIEGFREIRDAGERLPPASYYASRIATIVDENSALDGEKKYYLYQEVLDAVEAAQAAVMAERPS
jgi:hypothetical protein